VVFDAPYNHNVSTPRLTSWSHWRSVLLPLLGKQLHTDPNMDVFGVDVGAFDAYSGTESLMPLNDVKLGVQSKGRTRATSDALLAGMLVCWCGMDYILLYRQRAHDRTLTKYFTYIGT